MIISPSDHVTHLHQSGMPMVLIDRQVPGLKVDTVLVDNEHGSAEAWPATSERSAKPENPSTDP
ncbi:hypothetical protein [Actinocrispum wychmicini]|nr:hypothetical protein [Actinocrispum wychmicini]